MKTLILGHRGNLGSQLIKLFGKNAIGLDKKELDITDKKSIIEKIKELKPDIIINTVAYNAVDKCEEKKEFEKAKAINAEAIGILADLCAENKIILIHYSSDYVFGGNKKEGYEENSPIDPINKYGLTKALGEEKIINAKNLNYYLIRTSKLFGPKGSSSFSKPSFFDLMLDLAKKKKELSIIDEELSCFTYTIDLAKETKKLIEEKKEYGIYHIVNSSSDTWLGAAKTLFNLSGLRIKINKVSSVEFPRPAKRPKYSILKNTKIPELRNYEDALREYLEKLP